MYTPASFEVKDNEIIAAFIARHSFATLVSTVDRTPFATHLPLIVQDDGAASITLLGHVARANPHWRAFDSDHESLAIFHGPHAYISPQWYTVAPAVPTWNYAVVHAYGIRELVADEATLEELIDRTVQHYEMAQPQPWNGALPAGFKGKLMKAIVGFKIEITRVEAKFKLGQNRSEADQAGVVENLEQSNDANARQLADLMRQGLPDGMTKR